MALSGNATEVRINIDRYNELIGKIEKVENDLISLQEKSSQLATNLIQVDSDIAAAEDEKAKAKAAYCDGTGDEGFFNAASENAIAIQLKQRNMKELNDAVSGKIQANQNELAELRKQIEGPEKIIWRSISEKLEAKIRDKVGQMFIMACYASNNGSTYGGEGYKAIIERCFPRPNKDEIAAAAAEMKIMFENRIK